MKNVLKKMLLLSTALFLISSCAKKVDNSTGAVAEDKKSNSNAQMNFSVMMYADESATEGKLWKEALESYKTLHPNITFDVEVLFNEAYHDKLTARAASGTLPDIMYLFHSGRTSQVTDNNLVEDLRPLMDRDGLADKVSKNAFIGGGKNGEIWEYPLTTTVTTVLFQDTTKSNGYTFNTLDDLKKFTKETNTPALLVAAKDGWVMSSVLFGTLLGRVAGPHWLSETVEQKLHKFTDKEFIDTLYVLKDLYDSGVISKDNLNLGYGERMSAFFNGKTPILVDGEWASGDLAELFQDKQTNLNLIRFPSIKGEPNDTSSMTIGAGLGIKKGLPEDKKEAAWEFIKYYMGLEESTKRLTEGGIIPLYKLDATSLNLNDLVKKRIAFSNENKELEVIDAFLSGNPNEILNTGLQEVALGTKTPEELATEIQNTFDGS